MIYSSFFVHTNIGDNMKILLTGAASGIGYELAMKLIKNGHTVYLCVHTDEEIKTTLEKIKDLNYEDMISVMKLDVSKKKDRNLLEDLDIDVLVTLAATGYGGSLVNMDIRDIRKTFDTNFFGTLELVKFYIETRENKKGKVVVVSSIAGHIPLTFLGSYSSSKAALSTFMVSLNRELKKSNLNINLKLIEPGTYKTGFNQFLIDSKNGLDSKCFKQSMDEISEEQKKLFNIIEFKSLNTIVNKIYHAIESDSSKLVYRAPFIQKVMLKLYLFFVK